MRNRNLYASLLLLVLLLASTPRIRAADDPDRDAFERGGQAYARGNTTSACAITSWANHERRQPGIGRRSKPGMDATRQPSSLSGSPLKIWAAARRQRQHSRVQSTHLAAATRERSSGSVSPSIENETMTPPCITTVGRWPRKTARFQPVTTT